MKFNKKSLIRLAILSSVLGLNGFCGVANAEEKIYRPVANAEEKIYRPVAIKGDRADEEDREGGSVYSCVVCLGNVVKDQAILPCGHVFHNHCMRNWIKLGEKCPTCKRKTEEDEVKSVKESKCDLCKEDLSDGSGFILTSGHQLCGTCIVDLLKVDQAAQENAKNNDENKIHYALEKKFIEKYNLTEADRRNIQTVLNTVDDRFIVMPTGVLPVPEPKKSKKIENDKDKARVKDMQKDGKTDVKRDLTSLEKSNAVGLSNEELKKLGGKEAFYAGIQNKYATAQLQRLTDERANELLDKGDVAAVERMFDDADSYRTANELLFNDANNAILDYTSNAHPQGTETNSSNYTPGYNQSCGEEYGFVPMNDDRAEVLA